VQTFPHPPQLFGSLFVFVQAPPHEVCCVGQPVVVHAPATHASPAPHFVAQSPQCWKFCCMLTHWVPQSSVPASQPHLPAEQIWPFGQTVPQAPQLAGSALVSTQPPPQSLSGVVQPASQRPALQTWLAPHAVAQLPQCAGSLASETQLPEHSESPASQTHLAPLHTWLALHAVAQAPQWLASLPRSTQLEPHVLSGVVHEDAH
jgi:hypothetical protein